MKININNKNLAINGAAPYRNFNKKWLDNFTTDEKEKEAVIEVLDSGYLSLLKDHIHLIIPFLLMEGPTLNLLKKNGVTITTLNILYL